MATRLMLASGCVVRLVGCAARREAPEVPLRVSNRRWLPQFDDHAAEPGQRASGVGASPHYQVIDVDTLSKSDPRGYYGTPTVLIGDHDLFGKPTPAIQKDSATWRVYPDGVPSVEAIAERLRQ